MAACDSGDKRVQGTEPDIVNGSIFAINPLSPDINMHILLTVLHTFHIIPLGRICSKVKTFHLVDHFIHSRYLYDLLVSDNVRRN